MSPISQGTMVLRKNHSKQNADARDELHNEV